MNASIPCLKSDEKVYLLLPADTVARSHLFLSDFLESLLSLLADDGGYAHPDPLVVAAADMTLTMLYLRQMKFC